MFRSSAFRSSNRRTVSAWPVSALSALVASILITFWLSISTSSSVFSPRANRPCWSTSHTKSAMSRR